MLDDFGFFAGEMMSLLHGSWPGVERRLRGGACNCDEVSSASLLTLHAEVASGVAKHSRLFTPSSYTKRLHNYKDCFFRRDPPVLRAYNNTDIILRLPMGKRIRDIRWLSVWCRRFTVNKNRLLTSINGVKASICDT